MHHAPVADRSVPATATVAAPSAVPPQPLLWRERCWTPSGARTDLGRGGRTLATIVSLRGVHRLDLVGSAAPDLPGATQRTHAGGVILLVPETARVACLAAAHAAASDPVLLEALRTCGSDWHQ